jgi:T-box protein 2
MKNTCFSPHSDIITCCLFFLPFHFEFMQRLIDSHFHIFILTGWFSFANDSHFEDVRRRLQVTDDNERDGSDSNCSDSISASGGGGAFRPTGSESPKESSRTANSSYPSPNISVGPPIQPPPHILPYLYPHGIYNHVTPPLSLLHNPAMMNNPGLFLNAQLALAAQHPAFFGHYSGHSASSSSLHNHMKSNRFSPYSLPGFHNQQGSAFDAVTPSSGHGGGGKSSEHASAERSLSSSPSHNNHSPASNRPQSISPTPSQKSSITAHPSTSSSKNTSLQQLNNGIDDMNNGSASVQTNNCGSGTFSELKSIEKMVNGLEMHQNQNGNGNSSSTQLDLPRSVSPTGDEQCKRIVNHDH